MGIVVRCFLYPFYINPQLLEESVLEVCGCFLYPFYIKPQHYAINKLTTKVVSCIRSTSNHNLCL